MAGAGQLSAAMSGEEARRLSALLLRWFERHRRDLPWRRTSDPYRIWISEVMLQQTQVDRVIGYYDSFIEAFPTVQSLAAATPGDVLRRWEGLGYYSRAHNLHAAARLIVERHAGQFPRSVEDARALPGVGEYTAGAVLSIAFGLLLPALDANAIRVLARLFAIRGDLSKGQPRRRIEALASDAVPTDRPGDFNQALMELGALICIAGQPGCLLCPLTEICAARREGAQAEIPPPKVRPIRQVSAVAGVVRDGGGVLVVRKPAGGQWGGLWEFPGAPLLPSRDREQTLIEYLWRAVGIEARVVSPLAQFAYGVMNQRVELTTLLAERVGGTVRLTEHDEARWVHPDDLPDLAMPSPHRSIAEQLVSRR
ncbi:MAG: A/G-specific adenine glycosylase [Armatimonadota bacterium]|jgi:A/G-specific adenine glycosylase